MGFPAGEGDLSSTPQHPPRPQLMWSPPPLPPGCYVWILTHHVYSSKATANFLIKTKRLNYHHRSFFLVIVHYLFSFPLYKTKEKRDCKEWELNFMFCSMSECLCDLNSLNKIQNNMCQSHKQWLFSWREMQALGVSGNRLLLSGLVFPNNSCFF